MKHRNSIYAMIFMLIGSVLMSGVPMFVSEDANCDHLIDLRDAVLNAQRICPDAAGRIETTCISTMQSVAGVKEISAGSIEADDFSLSDFTFLIPCPDLFFASFLTEQMSDFGIFYKSYAPSLLHKPPIHV